MEFAPSNIHLRIMPRWVCKEFLVVVGEDKHSLVGSSLFPKDVSHHLLPKKVWRELGSPPAQFEYLGFLNSPNGCIEVQMKTTLTVEIGDLRPTLDFGIYDDTTIDFGVFLKNTLLQQVDPLLFPVELQSIILEDQELYESTCWACGYAIEGRYVLHCLGKPKPAHLHCFKDAHPGRVSTGEGQIEMDPVLCSSCHCPAGEPFDRPAISGQVTQVVRAVFPEAKMLSVSAPKSQVGEDIQDLKLLDQKVENLALRTTREESQARQFERAARILSLLAERTTRLRTGVNLLPKLIARDSLADEEGPIHYLITSLAPMTGTLARVKEVLELHRREKSPNGTFGFLPPDYYPYSFPSCEDSSTWSKFLRQWIASICHHYPNHKARTSTFVNHLIFLIEKLIEPLENNPEGIIPGLSLGRFDVDLNNPGRLSIFPLWGHWEFTFAGTFKYCDSDILEYLTDRADEYFGDRNQLYSYILKFHCQDGWLHRANLDRLTEMVIKHGGTVADDV